MTYQLVGNDIGVNSAPMMKADIRGTMFEPKKYRIQRNVKESPFLPRLLPEIHGNKSNATIDHIKIISTMPRPFFSPPENSACH